MKSRQFHAPALGAALSAAVLTACSSAGGVTPNGSPAYARTSSPVTTLSARVSAPPSGALLYVSAGRQNLIEIYDAFAPYKKIGQITTGLVGPNAQAVDSAGNLYVANADGASVVVYPPGATKPSVTYTQGLNNPLTPVIGADGTLYVSDFHPDGSGVILEYPPHQLTPSFRIKLSTGAVGLAVDAHNNVYASVQEGPVGRVLKFAPKSTNGKDLGISVSYAGRLTVDPNGNIIVCDQLAPAVDVFAPGQTKPSKQITTGFVDPFGVALSRKLERLYVADGAGKVVNVYSYPELTLLHVINRSTAAFGLSVNPPAAQ